MNKYRIFRSVGPDVYVNTVHTGLNTKCGMNEM